MDMMAGYKQTEVGIIPEDWEVRKFSEHFTIYAGGDAPRHSLSQTQSALHPYPIFANAISGSGLYGYTSEQRSSGNSLTVTARGYLGHAEYRDEPFFPIVRLLVLEPTGKLDARFTTYAINDRVEFALESTGVPQLTAPQIGKYSVAAPATLAEQRAIADALGDVDALLGGLDRLLAKKRDLKQAAMQQLLTGQTRLPGFREDWKLGSLRMLTLRATGVWGQQKPSERNSHRAAIIRAGDISQDGRLTGTATRFVSPEEFEKAQCHRDDLVITTSGNGLGKLWWCDRRADTAASNFVRVLRPISGRSIGRFLYYALRTGEGLRQLQEHTATSAYPNLRPSYFETEWIPIPPLLEQTAIATILSDMDAELEALEARRAKTRDLKQAMMQELLTGKTRLVTPEAAHA